MHAEYSSSEPAEMRSRPPSPWAWAAAIVVLLACAGYFLIVPLAETVVRGVGSLVGVVAQAAAAVATETHAKACRQVEDSPAVRALLGEPIVCAPVEHARWIEPVVQGEMEFEFDVDGSRGVGTAHVVAAPAADGLELTSVIVSGPDGAVLVVP